MYKADQIDRQLTIAAINFMDSETFVNDSTVTLSKILYWYYYDFADNDLQMLHFVSQYISQDDKKIPLMKMLSETPNDIKIRYAAYDWNHNSV